MTGERMMRAGRCRTGWRRAAGAALLTLGVAATGPAQAGGLSAREQTMVRTVEAGRERAISLLEQLVNVNSGTMNLAGVTQVGAMMRAELEPLGFTVRWVPMAGTGRAGHLIATRKGRADTKRLLLIGHLDTVFEPDSPFQTFVRRGDIAEGPGVNDMKGGLVIMVEALRAMQAAGTLKDANITIVLTGDEERVGNPQAEARADLVAAAKASDIALEFEGLARENGRDMGSIARRSSTTWRLVTTGKSGHSSGIFSATTGDGAIYEMARILAAFRSELPEPNLTFNVGLLVGGARASLSADDTGGTAAGKPNIIPAQAEARGDIRTLDDGQTARVQARMRAIVARHLPGTGAEIDFYEGYPAMAPTAGNRALLDRLNGVNRDLGLPEMPALDPLKRGAGDISFVAAYVDGLVGTGAAGEGAHAPGETVELASLDRQAKRAAILMSRLAAEKRAR